MKDLFGMKVVIDPDVPAGEAHFAYPGHVRVEGGKMVRDRPRIVGIVKNIDKAAGSS